MDFASLELPADLDYAGIRRPPPILNNTPTDDDIVCAEEFKRQVDAARHRSDREPTASVREAAESTIYAHNVVGSRRPPAWMQPMMTTVSAELRKVVSEEVKNAINDQMRQAISDQMKQAFGDHMKKSEERIVTRLSQMEQNMKRLGDEVKRLGDSMKESEQRTRTQARDELKQLRDEIKKLRDEVKTEMKQLGTRITSLDTELRRVHRLTVRAHIKMTQRDNGYFNDVDHLDEVPFADGTFPWNEFVAGPVGSGDVQLPPLSSVQAVSNLDNLEVYGYFRGYCPHLSNTGGIANRKKKILAAVGRRDVMPPPTA